jgi:hypothetical protein
MEEAFLYAVEAGVIGYCAKTAAASFRDPAEKFRREAQAYDDDELAERLVELHATQYVTDFGCEGEGSKTEFFAIYDSFFRTERAERKQALGQEARERDIVFQELEGDTYLVGKESEMRRLQEEAEEVVPEKDLRKFADMDDDFYTVQQMEERMYKGAGEIDRELSGEKGKKTKEQTDEKLRELEEEILEE